MSTRRTETSRILNATPNKRRSERLKSIPVSSNPKTPTLPSPGRKAVRSAVNNRTKGAPRREVFASSSSSSSSSSDESEDEYSISKEKSVIEDDHMEVDSDCSVEIGEHFSDDSIANRPSSTGSNSEKENTRRTRSQSRLNDYETPSKKVARDLDQMTVGSSKKNLFNGKSPAKKTEKQLPKSASRCGPKKSQYRVFNEDIDGVPKKHEEKPGKITIKIPNNMIPTKISPITLQKTPGGRWHTRRRARLNSDNEVDETDPLDSRSASTLEELASRLHLSKVPEKLPCRENESRDIEQFIREVIDRKKGESSAMYIGGVPGTGKTATVRAVVNSMKKNKKYPKFVYVEVNAMIFKKTVFTEVYNGIQEEFNISNKPRKNKITASAARQELNAIFKREDTNRPPIVILIDELDSLSNRKQDVLYDIFEWTALPQSKVTIIGIANTLDFPERMLCQRIASRFDKRRIVFQPYQHDQIEEIVRARLSGSKLIDAKAIELVSKKVASSTGDLRGALDFLCRAIRIAVEKKAERLELTHVIDAQKAVLEPLKYRIVKGLRLHQFTLFRAIGAKAREQEEMIFSEIYKNYCIICSEVSGIEPASDGFAYKMLLQLASSSLIVLTKGDHGIMNRKLKLGMTSHEAEKTISAAIEKNKSAYSI